MTLEIEDLVIPALASEYDTAIAPLKPLLKDESGKDIRPADITDKDLEFKKFTLERNFNYVF